MAQYTDTFNAPDTDPFATPKKTSGMAITGLVMSLIGIIPCCGVITAPIGAILGLIGSVTIKPTSAVKGKGMAITAFVVGAILTAAQIGGGYWVWNTMFLPVTKGPDDALKAGFAGDLTGFKAEFYGVGATASDAEAKAFIDQLRARYGEYQSCEMDQTQSQQQSFGQPEATFPYVLTFANKSVKCDAHMIFSDKTKGGFIMSWGSITVLDTEAGNLVYPGALPEAAPRTTLPGETTTAPETAPPSTPPDPTRP